MKKLRNSSNPFSQFKEKKVKKYLKLHKNITVEDSSSGEEEKEDQFKENVEDGFFSEDEKSEDETGPTDQNVPVAKFKQLFQQMIINQSIDDIQISQQLKDLHKTASCCLKQEDIEAPPDYQIEPRETTNVFFK